MEAINYAVAEEAQSRLLDVGTYGRVPNPPPTRARSSRNSWPLRLRTREGCSSSTRNRRRCIRRSTTRSGSDSSSVPHVPGEPVGTCLFASTAPHSDIMCTSARATPARRSIALVGASLRPNTPGHDLVRMVQRGGYRGIPINPNHDRTRSPLAVASERSSNAARSGRVCRSETSDSIHARRGDHCRCACRSDIRLRLSGRRSRCAAEQSPRGHGTRRWYCRSAAATAWAFTTICNALDCGFPSPRQPRPGSIALIAHSGSVFGALAHNDPRLRFALAVSRGQELTTTVADYIRLRTRAARGEGDRPVPGDGTRDPARFRRGAREVLRTEA